MEYVRQVEPVLTRLDSLFSNYEIYLFDLFEGRAFYVSPSIEELIGVTKESLGHQHVKPLADVCHPDDWTNLVRHLAQMRGGTDKRTKTVDFRLSCAHSGDYHHFISYHRSAGALLNRDDTLLGISTTYNDYLYKEWKTNCHFRDRITMLLETIHASLRTRSQLESFRLKNAQLSHAL